MRLVTQLYVKPILPVFRLNNLIAMFFNDTS